MSGTTPGGWPYVTPDDHPKEYPAASQQLAQELDQRAAVRSAAGFVVINPGGPKSVAFPAGRFAAGQPVHVVATIEEAAGVESVFPVILPNASAAGCQIGVKKVSGGWTDLASTVVQWVAVQEVQP